MKLSLAHPKFAALLAAIALGLTGFAVATVVVVQPANAAKKKSAKKCKQGFKKKGKKCVRRTLEVSSVNLVAASIKKGKVYVTGYSLFGYATKVDAFLSAKIVVSDGLGRETVRAYWLVGRGSNHLNFTGDFKLGLNSPNMSVKMVVGGVASNSIFVDN
jgi:hypothetical protein